MKLKRKFYKDMANDEYLYHKWLRAVRDLNSRKAIKMIVLRQGKRNYCLKVLRVHAWTDGMYIEVSKP